MAYTSRQTNTRNWEKQLPMSKGGYLYEALYDFSLVTFLLLATSQLYAQILFHADFENTSGPNDPDAWNANNVTAGRNV